MLPFSPDLQCNLITENTSQPLATVYTVIITFPFFFFFFTISDEKCCLQVCCFVFISPCYYILSKFNLNHHMHDCTVWSLQKSFSSSLTEPEFIVSDFAKWDRPAQLHLAYQSLDAFVKREGQLPRPYNKEDGLKLVELAKKINSEATNKVR